MKRTEIIAQLFDTMDVAKRSMHGHMRLLVAGHNVSRPQLEVLFTIHHTQPTTAKQLAQKLQLTPGAISQLTEELVEQSLIERQTDTADRRRQLLSLSPAGSELIKAFDKRRRHIMERVMQDLSDDELAAWLKIQRTMISEFKALQKENERKQK
jgi:MarR family transcriptional regulator for hemolysin